MAVIELADACGLTRLPGGAWPLTASSFGAGEVLAAALAAGARRIILGVGGSASTDGGAGLLQALGARVLDARGEPLARGGRRCATLPRWTWPGCTRRCGPVRSSWPPTWSTR